MAVDCQKSLMHIWRKEHLVHQYRAMHFGNDTKWQTRDATLHFSFVYKRSYNQRIALIAENQNRKNLYQVDSDP